MNKCILYLSYEVYLSKVVWCFLAVVTMKEMSPVLINIKEKLLLILIVQK